MNFLAKTITNLESRLDSVLLGEQEQQQQQQQQQSQKKPAAEKKSVDNGSKGGKAEGASTPERTGSPAPSISRTGTPSGGSGGKLTLAERLAAATARSASPGLRSVSPAPGVGSARSSIDQSRGRGSLDVTRTGLQKGQEKTEIVKKDDKSDSNRKGDDAESVEVGERTAVAAPPPPDVKPESTKPVPPAPAADRAEGVNTSSPAPVITVTPTPHGVKRPSQSDDSQDYEAILSQLRSDLATCEIRRQEESHTASERIDALENKLKILARESADDAKRRATASPPGGLEKKLAEKEERIALLLEEGERLSKLELKNLTIIKKLRAKMIEDEKASGDLKRKLEKAEKEVVEGREKLKKATETEKKLNERIKAVGKLENEVEVSRREKNERDYLILDLKAQLAEANLRADEAEGKVRTGALEAERKTTRDLKEQIEKNQSEATLIEENLRTEVNDLRAKIGRDSDRAKLTEAELRSELAVMESKLEILRARAEEVSSGAAGNAHSKLLRQVETLQTQYSIASENWQGIEGSLLARVAAVERERDELAKTEGEVRRKAREFNNKARRLELDIESTSSRIKDLEEDLDSSRKREETLQKKIATLDSSLTESRLALDRAKEEFSREVTQQLDEQRMKWEEQLASSSLLRSPSPPLPSRFSGRSVGRGAIHGERESYSQSPFSPSSRRDTSASGSFVEQQAEVTLGRGGKDRTSFSGPHRVDSNTSLGLPQFIQHQGNSSRSSLAMGDDGEEDYFINNRPGSSPRINNTNTSGPNVPNSGAYPPLSPSYASPLAQNFPRGTPGPQDLVSVSTVAAGPSVQLVERMSSSIRRLETEMAASRDELTRTLNQRDEARAEIVELMREVESKREVEEKNRVLEQEKEALDNRFQAALETLGEKMERVDELEEMVMELKRVYRELVMKSSGGV